MIWFLWLCGDRFSWFLDFKLLRIATLTYSGNLNINTGIEIFTLGLLVSLTILYFQDKLHCRKIETEKFNIMPLPVISFFSLFYFSLIVLNRHIPDLHIFSLTFSSFTHCLWSKRKPLPHFTFPTLNAVKGISLKVLFLEHD